MSRPVIRGGRLGLAGAQHLRPKTVPTVKTNRRDRRRCDRPPTTTTSEMAQRSLHTFRTNSRSTPRPVLRWLALASLLTASSPANNLRHPNDNGWRNTTNGGLEPATGNYHVQAAACADKAACLERINAEVLLTVRAHRRAATPPCGNFWDHACGEWTAAPFYDHADTFGALGNRYAGELLPYLVPQEHNNNVDHHSEREEVGRLLDQLRTYYQACRQTDGYFLKLPRYLEALPPLRHAPWPAVLRALRGEDRAALEGGITAFDWLRAAAELRRYGLNGLFFSESVGMAHNDSARSVLQLEMPASDGFASESELHNYFLEFSLVGAGMEVPSAWHARLAGRVYTLEARLRELRAEHREAAGEDSLEESLTMAELRDRVPHIDWLAYFQALFEAEDYAALSAPLRLPVELEGAEYLNDVAALLRRTEPAIVALYMLLRLCKHLAEGAPQITARNCVHHMGVTMPLGLDYVYDRFVYAAGERRAYDERVLPEMFAALKQQFRRQLEANKLRLNRAERHFLHTKLGHMRLRIGNLPQGAPPAFYDAHYAAVNLSATDFYHNHLEMLRFRTRQQHRKLLLRLGESLDEFFVNDDLRQVRNAPYFVHQRNLLVVPMMFLQMPFYHHRLHPLLQYSLVGWIVAHEMNHAFETDGLLFDGRGSGEGGAMGAAIAGGRRFAAGVSCLARRPTAALIERIADVNGFQLVWDAYFGGVVASEVELAQHFGTPARAHELFFLNFAQFFCGSLPRAIDHDRDDVRVNEVVANMREFAQVFACAAGERENPAEKCEMWRS